VKRRPAQRDRDDDAATEAERFARAMDGVRKIAADPRGRVQAPPVVSPLRSGQNPRRTDPPRPSAPTAASEQADDDSATGFAAPGVDRRELRKLKRGDYIPGKRLDLHGMTGAEAVASVTRFIEKSRGLHRCVSIVHGRGLRSAGNVAVLKTRVRACLRQHGAVLAYADAPRNDGGPGAVYVLLRK
jgi:DNA-nicking Smr family endonuclease